MTQAASDFGRRKAEIETFVAAVWDHHHRDRRDLPWRRTFDPYEILVSEIMLQQTQVARVLEKYPQFLAAFPTVEALAAADVGAVLSAWQGLGYNRRALALHRAAVSIVQKHGGRVPCATEDLRALPGIGPYTAAAMAAFAFGRAEPFIETNIRAAFIHAFFPDRDAVGDADILPLVEATMDRADPREWFYALMDYGVWVKRTFGNPGRRSKHHSLQSRFEGSRREVRASLLQAVLAAAPGSVDTAALPLVLGSLRRSRQELIDVADALVKEGFLEKTGAGYRVAGAAEVVEPAGTPVPGEASGAAGKSEYGGT